MSRYRSGAPPPALGALLPLPLVYPGGRYPPAAAYVQGRVVGGTGVGGRYRRYRLGYRAGAGTGRYYRRGYAAPPCGHLPLR